MDRDLLEVLAARHRALSAAAAGIDGDGWCELRDLLLPAVGGVRRSHERCAAVVDEALGRPSHRLVAYGTLRPGSPNHRLLSGRGTWEPVTVRGWLAQWEGYPVLHAAPRGGPALPAMLFTTARLPELVPDLDRFEGPAYRRSWVVAELGPRAGREPEAVVAQCYIGAGPAASAGDDVP